MDGQKQARSVVSKMALAAVMAQLFSGGSGSAEGSPGRDYGQANFIGPSSQRKRTSRSKRKPHRILKRRR